MTALTKKYSFDEVYDAQTIYRLLLTAMSNPTRTVNIKECADRLYGEHPELLALAFTLLDNEVSFSVLGCETLADDIGFLTLSTKVPAENADYIFVTEASKLEEAIATAKIGTLHDPHQSATLIIKNYGRPSSKIRFVGPGIDQSVEVAVTETVQKALALRDAQNCKYPQGIDLIFVSEDGNLFAIPRLVSKEVL